MFIIQLCTKVHVWFTILWFKWEILMWALEYCLHHGGYLEYHPHSTSHMNNTVPYHLDWSQTSSISQDQSSKANTPWILNTWQGDFWKPLQLISSHTLLSYNHCCWTHYLIWTNTFCHTCLNISIKMVADFTSRWLSAMIIDTILTLTENYTGLCDRCWCFSHPKSQTLCLKSSILTSNTMWHCTNGWPMGVFVPSGKILNATLKFFILFATVSSQEPAPPS